MQYNKKKSFLTSLFIFCLILAPIILIIDLAYFQTPKESTFEYTSDVAPTAGYFTEKHFVVILPLTKNINACEQTLASIITQKYEQCRIIFIETKSTKACGDHLLLVATKQDKRSRITRLLVDDETSLFSGYQKAVATLNDDDIVVQINPHDWLAHDDVLQKINRTYAASEEVWLVYGQYLEYPSYKKGTMKPYLKKMIRNRSINKIPWLSSHFKTYYAHLFKQYCKTKNTMAENPLEETLNLSLLPMVEMSKNHIRYMEDILYIHSTKPLGSN